MRAVEKIEAQIQETTHKIAISERLNRISKFAGAEDLRAMFDDTKAFYEKAIRALDENSPILNKEYAKLKACLELVDGFVSGIASAENSTIKLNQLLVELHAELKKTHDEIRRREKTSF
jgi:hypothetical protein